jgi:hypothetical protein
MLPPDEQEYKGVCKHCQAKPSPGCKTRSAQGCPPADDNQCWSCESKISIRRERIKYRKCHGSDNPNGGKGENGHQRFPSFCITEKSKIERCQNEKE